MGCDAVSFGLHVRSAYFLKQLSYHEDGDSRLFLNTGACLPNFTVSHLLSQLPSK